VFAYVQNKDSRQGVIFRSFSTGTNCTICKLKGIMLSAAEIVVEGIALLDKNIVLWSCEIC
jgi:hypothetical protein